MARTAADTRKTRKILTGWGHDPCHGSIAEVANALAGEREEAVKVERERCANIAETLFPHAHRTTAVIAAAIRNQEKLMNKVDEAGPQVELLKRMAAHISSEPPSERICENCEKPISGPAHCTEDGYWLCMPCYHALAAPIERAIPDDVETAYGAVETVKEKAAEIVIPLADQLSAGDLETAVTIVTEWQRSSGIRLFADQQGWKLERLIAASLADKEAEVWDAAIAIVKAEMALAGAFNAKAKDILTQLESGKGETK